MQSIEYAEAVHRPADFYFDAYASVWVFSSFFIYASDELMESKCSPGVIFFLAKI